MSNDLISRSALIQSLRNNVLVDVTPNLEQAIAEQSTAYNVDKVVEEMKDLLWDCYTDSGDGIDRKTGFEAYKREMERIFRY